MFPLLLAGHLIGDWWVQTDWQAANKVCPAGRRLDYGYWQSWKANQQHMLGYHLTLLLAICWVTSVWQAAVILAVSWLTHSFIDRRWPVRWLMSHTGSAAFGTTAFGMIAGDQALHLSILAVLSEVVK